MPTGGGGNGQITGWPLAYFSNASLNNNIALDGANQISVSGFALPYRLTFSKIAIGVITTDATNLYDVGIYTQAGALVANIGAQTLPTNQIQTTPIVQGAITIPPGMYLFAFTGNANTATLDWFNSGYSWVFNQNVAASSGGALPASIGAVAEDANQRQWWFHLL
jgi:hypothetical protein